MISSISQINRGAVNFITTFDEKEQVQQIIDKFLKEQYPQLEEEAREVIRYNNRSPVRSGRDVNLLTTIITY